MATLLRDVPHAPRRPTELDRLIADVCEALQISAAQYANAVEKYQNVGRWLAAPDSPLAYLKPDVYPQGSMALGTTTRPWNDSDTYDLDIVLQVVAISEDPMVLYDAVERRLLESPHYRDILKRKKRCLCLNFEGKDNEFHMDILPARADDARGGTCIEVPDRKTPEKWQPSNPIGFKAWFERQAQQAAMRFLKAHNQAPLPDNDPAHAKTILQRAVQLMKRRRDLVFKDPDLAPRSVVLTTLAGTHYAGEQDVVSALISILSGISASIEAARPERIVVCNPTNSDEKFCESFKTAEQYDAFTGFVTQLLGEVRGLLALQSLDKMEAALAKMFGEKITQRALAEYKKRLPGAPAIITSRGRSDSAEVQRLEELRQIALGGEAPAKPWACG